MNGFIVDMKEHCRVGDDRNVNAEVVPPISVGVHMRLHFGLDVDTHQTGATDRATKSGKPCHDVHDRWQCLEVRRGSHRSHNGIIVGIAHN